MGDIKEALGRINIVKNLDFVGMSSGVLRDRVELEVKHIFYDPIACDLKTDELPEIIELYKITNGALLFVIQSSVDVECAIRLFSCDELGPAKLIFIEAVDQNKSLSHEEWEEFLDDGNDDPMPWIEQLVPIGEFGSGGDLIVIDKSKEIDSDGRVMILNFEMYAAGGPIEPGIIDDSWSSLSEFIFWLSEDICNRMPSTFIYEDPHGQQFSVAVR